MDQYNLARFIEAQELTFSTALEEVSNGKKQTHWMWYIFPQLAALGYSQRSQFYGIRDLAEAKAYMENPYLATNLLTITKALLYSDKNDPVEVFGEIDALKLHSCMTLFEVAAPFVVEFSVVLERFFHGRRDELTLSLLGY